jgi:leucine dehydrogenase
MNYFEHPEFSGHEHVSFVHDEATGLQAIIAIHSTRGGFSGGGIRFFPYASSGDALYDVLRLSKGMTYKAALAGLPFGGGKSVILGDPTRLKTEALLEAFGGFVHRLGGKYICAEDMGMTPDDMVVIQRSTPYVTGLPGKSGDTSPLTGFGVYRALSAAAERRLKRPLASAAILGFGNVGRHLASHLHNDGVKLFVADVNTTNVVRAVQEFGATAVSVEALFALEVDAIAPCSIGAVLNARTIPMIRAPIVCGGANNQLANVEADGDLLARHGVLFVPDYIANAGGVISGSAEFLCRSAEQTHRAVADIFDTCTKVFRIADETGTTPLRAAETLARQILRSQSGSQ